MARRPSLVAFALVAFSAATAFTPASPRLRLLATCRRQASARAAARGDVAAAAAAPVAVPPLAEFESPVLALVYPSLRAHVAAHGHPNIPLGSADGTRCRTLRRLHFQGKLSAREAEHLQELGFRFHSFEDVYYECDFDEMLAKLQAYREESGTYQIPKKYVPDPELGAWVTMLRRLKKTDGLPQAQVDELDAVGFEWISARKCGSAFMAQYRELLARLGEGDGSPAAARDLLRGEPGLRKWIAAQRLAHEHGNLPDSRVQYMDDLPGVDWKDPGWAREP